jgi:hypothetical protein
MTTLEAHLVSLEAQIGGTENAISALVTTLKRLKKAVGYGHLAEINKNLPLVAQRAEEVRKVALPLSDAWSLDVTKHDAESFEGMFVAVLADSSFVGDNPKRSVAAYTALKERIWADVHARGHEKTP